MGFAAAIPLIKTAVPYIASGIGALLGRNKGKPSSQEQGMAAQQQAGAQQLGAQGQQLLGAGMPLVKSAGNYYQQLLMGNRAQLQNAVAPETNQIADLYRGAERGLERSNLVGAQRDQASAELNRDRVGKMAGAALGVRPAAAAAAGSLGQGLTAGAQSAFSGQANILDSLLSGARDNRQIETQQGASWGGTMGRMLADLLGNYKGGGGGTSGIPDHTLKLNR